MKRVWKSKRMVVPAFSPEPKEYFIGQYKYPDRYVDTDGCAASTFLCVDCGYNCKSESYMVNDTVWPIGYLDGHLCVGCIETRIGRRLEPSDFTPCLLNEVDLDTS